MQKVGAKTESLGIFRKVYRVVKAIPKGKIATYGQVAKVLGIKDARIIGWALHKNTDPSIPCFRVVNKDGRVASGYAFGGWKAQKTRLLAEGVRFVNTRRVSLDQVCNLAVVLALQINYLRWIINWWEYRKLLWN
jgi:methylated-DNA-protein-cysteine methyltransferase-like protein